MWRCLFFGSGFERAGKEASFFFFVAVLSRAPAADTSWTMIARRRTCRDGQESVEDRVCLALPLRQKSLHWGRPLVWTPTSVAENHFLSTSSLRTRASASLVYWLTVLNLQGTEVCFPGCIVLGRPPRDAAFSPEVRDPLVSVDVIGNVCDVDLL